jgi:hypothetical protein
MEFTVYKNKLILGKLFYIKEVKHGIVSHPDDINFLYNINGQDDIEILNEDEGKWFNFMKIVDDFVYYIGFKGNIVEYNPDLEMLSTKACRWNFVEMEYKINILSKETNLFHEFNDVNLSGFSKGKLSTQKTREKFYYNKIFQGEYSFFALLSWSHEKGIDAIKLKSYPQNNVVAISRKTKIIDYNEDNLNLTFEFFNVSSMADLEELSEFSKVKKRFIVVDEFYGFIYGLSYSIARTIHKEIFCQIEIEYWSEVVYDKKECTDIAKSFLYLIDRIKKYLCSLNICFTEKPIQKIDWLKSISYDREASKH